MNHSVKTALMMSAALLWAMPVAAQEAITELDEVVLGESKREVKTDIATSETTVDQEEIEDRQASTIAELADSVPGVTLVNGQTPQGSGINIRGFGATGTYGSDQKVLIQVDDADVGAEELYRIGTQLYTDPSLYKRVDVIRGMAGTFEYGSGAIGGMVRLETKDASDFTGGLPGVRLRQTLQFSSNGDGITSSTIMAWQPTADFEVLGNYTYSTQDTQTDGSGNAIGNSAFSLPSWQLKVRKTFGEGDHSLSFSLTDTSSDDKDVPYDTFVTTGGSFGNVDRQIRSRTATLGYNYNPLDNDMIDLDVILSYADQKIDQSYVPGSSPLEGTPTFPFLQPLVDADHRYETTKLTMKNTARFQTGLMGHNLRTGIELKHKERLDASSAPGGTDKRLALFIVDDITIGDRLTLTPALRYERQKVGNDAVSYSNNALMGGVSAFYKLDGGFAVFGSAAFAENLPIIDDLDNPTYMTQSEKARTFELGLSYDRFDTFTSGDTLSFKVTAYKTQLWDVTSYTTSTATPIGDADLEGVELEAAYSLSSGFYMDLNANIQRGTYSTPAPGGDWSGIPADQLRVTFGKKWQDELDLSWEVVANREMTRSTTPSPSNVVHNLRATYRPQHGLLEGTELRLGIENLFDKDYTPHLATRVAPGRNVKFTLAKTF
ncbi:hemoglobin/transferrin/lactoferrin receptor protein [Lutimaribacter pacificus]|uniref:Hemoglobin/transferrin/lactoferrin receptor protein n=1 Tax=Lutimaribacter pacificus TaxID=391948 RepID=A0A1H0HNC4_9RHOB|nr:TonB-dependent receptor [Lutimaribacter pacificus]SDO20662.1 hemoglobin/transferrin/lactoferrin receptor protein [Lutimaribacter pacificus]SHK33557.1 hemoglobin/transferrin/lactoferrin receptor protein [Lutimaribacter pacificus]